MRRNEWLCYVIAGHEQSDAVRTPVVTLCADLELVAQVGNQSGDWEGFVMSVTVVEALGPHVAAEESGICSQAGNGHSHVSVNRDDLFLVGRQLRSGSFQCNNDCMGAAFEANGCRSLFDSLHGIFHLVDPSLRTPDSHVIVVLVTEL